MITSVDSESKLHGMINMLDVQQEIMPKIGLLIAEVESSLTSITNFKVFTPDTRGADEFKFMIKVKLR